MNHICVMIDIDCNAMKSKFLASYGSIVFDAIIFAFGLWIGLLQEQGQKPITQGRENVILLLLDTRTFLFSQQNFVAIQKLDVKHITAISIIRVCETVFG